jgi:isopropanol dehydrogenase (NADP+)
MHPRVGLRSPNPKGNAVAKVMRGLAYLGENTVGLVERDIPVAGPGEAIVRTTASLICTSDVHTVARVLPVRRHLV